MIRVSLLAFVLAGAVATAQTCLTPAPAAPPQAQNLVCILPADGGTTGCQCYGTCDSCKGSATRVAVSNAKCAQAVTIANQSVANDNGWNDGGTP